MIIFPGRLMEVKDTAGNVAKHLSAFVNCTNSLKNVSSGDYSSSITDIYIKVCVCLC